ncbi:MAG: gamma-glutamyltransferase, partial [Calditrichaeota bacterium]|nr:gamma-glutamyltransferase [Calditrichota bacterium]
MVATPHPAATEAAVEILKQGGNAVDAAIAAAFVVSVAEQYHSGLGGGEFALVWRQGMETPAALDARECAPGYAAADMFIDRKTGQPDGDRSWKGGLAVGVPGSVKGRVQLHQRYGRLDWERVVAPAIRLARDGLVVNRILHGNIDRLKDDLASDSAASTIFLSTGTTPRRGDTLYQPTLARTLEQIALDQGASFYKGVQAKAIVRSVVRTGGIMTLKDLADYRVVWRRPLVVETSASGTASAHQIWTMSPPSSGGFCITLMLNILRHVPLDSMSPGSADQIHMIAQAMERAFADRAAYLGDPDFSPMPYPLNDITHGEYYEEAIDRRERKPVTGPGNYKLERIEAPDRHTSHISVIDGEGHMCALTTSVNTAFGSLVFVPELGIFLNNT